MALSVDYVAQVFCLLNLYRNYLFTNYQVQILHRGVYGGARNTIQVFANFLELASFWIQTVSGSQQTLRYQCQLSTLSILNPFVLVVRVMNIILLYDIGIPASVMSPQVVCGGRHMEVFCREHIVASLLLATCSLEAVVPN